MLPNGGSRNERDCILVILYRMVTLALARLDASKATAVWDRTREFGTGNIVGCSRRPFNMPNTDPESPGTALIRPRITFSAG